MIKDPPLLTIRRAFNRPDPAILAAFQGAQTGNVVDAMNGRGSMDFRIKPLLPVERPVVGVAVTSDNGPADNLALFGAMDIAQPGDVLVAASDGFTGVALTGDLMIGMMRNKGIAGLVTDGLVRDIIGIADVGLPVYCAGVTPNSPVRNGPGTVGFPVNVGGVRVESGDIIVADRDGVVVVPQARAAHIAERLAAVKVAEAALMAKVAGGLQMPDFVRSVLDSDRIEWVE
jgi:4-hydroxy-4-methyl-2-oxoglutarate aldolase